MTGTGAFGRVIGQPLCRAPCEWIRDSHLRQTSLKSDAMSRKMPKSEQTVLNWIKRGDGQGEGQNYKPFFTVRFSSRGRTWTVTSPLTGRDHQYASDLEYWYHFPIEFTPGVSDIREQFALLPREETQHIAEVHGIRHPRYPRTTIFDVRTSDSVITIIGPDGPHTHVFAIKYEEEVRLGTDPGNPPRNERERKEEEKRQKEVLRTLQLLHLEREYWRARGAHWYLSTDKTLQKNRAVNLEFFHPAMLRRRCEDLNRLIPDFARVVMKEWRTHPFCTLNRLLEVGACALRVSVDDAFTLMGRSIWTRLLPVDLDSEQLHHLSSIRLMIER